jgi:hypothetical protein
MTIKERFEQIQKLADQLQTDINSLDQGFKYYNIMIFDFSENPMTIFILNKDESRENASCAQFQVDLLDLYYTSRFKEQLDVENERLITTNAPNEQISELNKIRELFGIV